MEAVLILAVLVVLGYGVFWAFMLYEIASRPDEAYREAGQSKWLWFIIVLVLQFFGTLGYFFLARKELQRAEQKTLPPATQG